jgi:hypothetical protein
MDNSNLPSGSASGNTTTNQGNSSVTDNTSVGGSYYYNPITDKYDITDPLHTAMLGFNSLGSKQPYASNLAAALKHFSEQPNNNLS